jgi:hypothetical protein
MLIRGFFLPLTHGFFPICPFPEKTLTDCLSGQLMRCFCRFFAFFSACFFRRVRYVSKNSMPPFSITAYKTTGYKRIEQTFDKCSEGVASARITV